VDGVAAGVAVGDGDTTGATSDGDGGATPPSEGDGPGPPGADEAGDGAGVRGASPHPASRAATIANEASRADVDISARLQRPPSDDNETHRDRWRDGSSRAPVVPA